MTTPTIPANPAATTAGPQAALQAAQSRLHRLEAFLNEDPDNTLLLAQAFEAALSCSEFPRAAELLNRGLSSGDDPWSWRLKQADWFLAQRRFEEAQRVLQHLEVETGAPAALVPVVQHNLSFIDLQRGAYSACVERLAPLMALDAPAPTGDDTLTQALQTLWLRGLHRTGELDRAMTWARSVDAVQALTPQAAGIASQIALDADDMHAAQQWAARALTQAAPTLEALNTAASLALGQSDGTTARRCCEAALALQPHDGRSLSVLGFTDLLLNDMPAAEARFRESLQHMPEHIGTWHGLALSLVLQGRLEEAKSVYEKTIEMDRNFAESHGGLAVVLALQQQPAKAREALERARRLDRQSFAATYADALLASGGPEEAQRLLRRIMQAGPQGKRRT